MDPRETVYRAIERRQPPRVPIHYCNRDFFSADTITVGYAPAAGFSPGERGATEWGYVWQSLDGTMGQPHSWPLADWSAWPAYRPPDPYAPGRFDAAAATLATNHDRFARLSIGISGFNVATFLRGFGSFLEDLYLAPERAEALLDTVFSFEEAIIEQALRLPVDAIAFGDDWGTQQGLMIAPDRWRATFKPRYAHQFATIHRAGRKVWFHTCGNVLAVIPDLIEAGVDVLELLQPDLFGVETLAREFGERVCFCCSVDHQRRAVSGSRDEIFAYASRLQQAFAAQGGGFIAYVEDYASLGMSEQNYQWIRQAFHGLPPYEWKPA
ncbi:MAG: uroporphyrinogen decarboxylase family protein [Anaerolineae bacterium]